METRLDDFRRITARLMGEVGALLDSLRANHVGGVSDASTAHGHIGPLPIGIAADDRKSAADSDSLCFVAGEGIAVVEVAFIEIPVGKLSGLWVAVELDSQAALAWIDADSLLGRAAERIGGSTDDIEPLRALHDFRSSGGIAHLAGSQREASMKRLGIQGMTTINAFDHVALRITACLEHLTELIDRLDPQGY